MLDDLISLHVFLLRKKNFFLTLAYKWKVTLTSIVDNSLFINISVLKFKFKILNSVVTNGGRILSLWLLKILMLCTSPAFGQCWVTLYVDSVNSDTVHICKGDTVTMNADGQCVLINSNFNSGTLGDGWNYCTPNFIFHAPCDTSLIETNYLWFGEDCVPNRRLESVDLNMTNGGQIAFSLKFGIQGDQPSCEGPDELWDGVSVQYSTDEGITWVDIVYFAPNGTIQPANPNVQTPLTYWPTVFCQWDDYSFNIPTAAQTPHTRIRWIQTHCSYFNNHYDDNWGLDNVTISNSSNTGIEWGTASSGTFVPDSTATYVVYILGLGNPPDTVAIDSVTIVVHNLPGFTINGDTTICSGDEVNLSVSGSYEFLWSNGSIGSNLITSPVLSTLYFVTATDNLGCRNVKKTNITVNQLPLVTAIGDTVCKGSDAQLTATGGVNYLWSNSNSGAQIIVHPESSTLYQVSVTDTNGCVNTASASVLINQVPEPGLDNHFILCFGNPLIVKAEGGVVYEWSNGLNTPQVVLKPETNSTFFVTVTNSEGCSHTDSIVVYVSPEYVISAISSADSICAGESLTLSASGGDYYEWSNGKRTAEIEVEPEKSTYYSVTVSNIFSGKECAEERQLFVNVNDCNVVFLANAFSPKGYNSIFKPIGQLENVTDYSFRIFNRSGKQLFETRDPFAGWDGRYNGEFVENGVYVYILRFMPEFGTKGFEKLGSLLIVE